MILSLILKIRLSKDKRVKIDKKGKLELNYNNDAMFSISSSYKIIFDFFI
jgi:hypothetical protein